MIARKKEAYKKWCKIKNEKNKVEYKTVKNKAKKGVVRAMKEEAEKEMDEPQKSK